MDRVVVNAMRRVEELRTELAELENFLRVYGRLGGDVGEPAALVQGGSRLPPRRQVEPEAASFADDVASAHDASATPPGVIAQQAIKILRASGRDMERQELVDAIEGGGLRIASKDKAGYLLVIMNRNVKGLYAFEGRRLRALGGVRHEVEERKARGEEA